MLGDYSLEQPDRIGNSITRLEGLLPWDFVKAPDGNLQDGNQTVL